MALRFTAEECRRGYLVRLALGPAVGRDAVAGGGRLRGFIQVEMGTDDLDGLYGEFLAKGIPVHSAPRDRGFERQMQLRDPDGFTVEFAEAGPQQHPIAIEGRRVP